MNISCYFTIRPFSRQLAWTVASLCLTVPLGCQPDDPDTGSHSRLASEGAPLALDAAQVTDAAPELFEDVTSELGIDFVHRPVEHEQTYFMPRCVGSGGAFFDFDGDGLLDLYLVQNAGPDSEHVNQLYHQRDGRFVNVSANSGLDVGGYGMGVACGDVNNDGRVDVVLNEYGRARLLLNQTQDHRPRFEDVSEAAGVSNPMWGTSASFVDFDRDGWLDLVLVNYVNYDPSRWCADGSGRQDFCGPDAFPGRVSKLFRNRGADAHGQVSFEDVTVSSGLSDRPGPGLGVFCADFNGDLWPDIFIANDGQPNHLWINQRNGKFQEEAITRGLGYNAMGKTEADMGIAIGDVDTDGMFDIFVTHLTTETHTLWHQGPRGIFVDRTATSGVTRTAWRGTGFGTTMGDLDNDGDLDLIVANGRVTRTAGPLPPVRPSLPDFWHPYAERDQILLNDGQGRFQDASVVNRALCQLATVSRGLACADFDNDGHLDILVTEIAGPPKLLRNKGGKQGHWLQVRARDPKLNRSAHGAEVYVQSGKDRRMRWINPGYSYLCSNDPRAHFGLGSSATYDQIIVVWPDGAAERFAGGDADREVTLRRGDGETIDTQELANL